VNGPLLQVNNLSKHYPITEGVLNTEVGRVRAVDGISFEVDEGEIFGIVGESGCGKSTAAQALLRLEEPTDGEIIVDGEDITEYGTKELRRFRRTAQMIFQDPKSSFDPRMNIETSVGEPLIAQGLNDKQRRREIIGDLLERVGLSAEDMKRYPHEFSGGQIQRLGLARALTVNPKILIADEPVSALDVSIQSEILSLIDEFKEELGLAVVVISHNLGVVREVCDRVAVMYLGEFVEVGPTEELFDDPQHPYTRALLSSIPTPDPTERGAGVELSGTVPDPAEPPDGCRFHTRCPEVIPPQGVSLEQETWRNLLHFRKQVESGEIDVESIAEVGRIDSDKYEDLEDPDLDEIETADLKRWIREEYGLSESLGYPLDEVLSESIEALLSDGIEAAQDRLDGEFTTVCEREKPKHQSCGVDHEAACHLLDANQRRPEQTSPTD
jgi:peptide/nickel transport system ATP-binding protein